VSQVPVLRNNVGDFQFVIPDKKLNYSVDSFNLKVLTEPEFVENFYHDEIGLDSDAADSSTFMVVLASPPSHETYFNSVHGESSFIRQTYSSSPLTRCPSRTFF